MILLTGATGFVGGHLLNGLLKEGLSVRCLVRPTSPKRHLVEGKGEVVLGDILRPESLAPAFQGIKVVIHLVGIIQEGPGVTFEAVHAVGSKNVVDEAAKAGVSKFIHMSALGAREGAASRYHRTKWQAEQYLRASGLDYAIFRPSIIFGPGDGFITKLADLIKRLPMVPVIASGDYQLQPIYIGDVVTCFLKAVKNPSVRGVFEIGGPERLAFKEILDIVSEALRMKKGRINIPLSIMKPLAFIMETFMKQPPVTREQLKMLGEGNICDLDKMGEVFPFKLTTLREGIATYIRPA